MQHVIEVPIAIPTDLLPPGSGTVCTHVLKSGKQKNQPCNKVKCSDHKKINENKKENVYSILAVIKRLHANTSIQHD
jgi:hypothetical protein